jgi:TolB protein
VKAPGDLMAVRKWWLSACVGLLLVGGVVGLVESGTQDVVIDVTRSDFEKIPIGLFGIQATGTLERSAGQFADVLRADLKRSLVFALMDVGKYGVKLNGELDKNVKLLKEVADSGVTVLVWGNMTPRESDIVLDGFVYDAGSGETVVGKRYAGASPTLRLMAHRLADELVNRYTGESGIARTKIAFISELGKSRELYVMDYDGYAPRQLTADGFLTLMPRWSADRRFLYYTSYREDRTRQEIHRLEVATGRRQVVVSDGGLNMTPAVSPDGGRLAFASSRTGNTEIFVLDQSTNTTQQLTVHTSGDLSPSWSPTGQDLAFTSDRSGRPQVYIMSADGSNVRRLTYEGDYNAAPAWSPKGNWIAHVCRTETRQFKLCLTSPDGQKHRQLTTGHSIDDSPSWAPDGRHLVFSSVADGKSHLYMINVDGSGLERLTSGGMYHSDPAWSPA